MKDEQLLRYSRHILLPQISYDGQVKLNNAHVLIIGLGGLGSPVALYLSASGIGKLTLCDYDNVDLSNLQRQIVHTTKSIGKNKAISAKKTVLGINPEIDVFTLAEKKSALEMAEYVEKADVVVDCSDNFATRYALNSLSLQFKKILVSGSAMQFDGQVTTFDFRKPNQPCYHCLFSDTHQHDEVRCADEGVFSPLVGIVGSIQSAEVIKCLLGIEKTLYGRLLLIDSLNMIFREVSFFKDSTCPVCS